MTTPPSDTPMADSIQPSLQDTHYQNVKDRLNAYVAAMAPGLPIDPLIGAGHQLGLWRTIEFILKHEGGEFNSLWSLLLQYVAEHRKGVFNERYVARFLEYIKLSVQDRQNFERLIRLILVTCEPSSRHLTIRQVDLKTTLAKVTDNTVRMRITGFYGV